MRPAGLAWARVEGVVRRVDGLFIILLAMAIGMAASVQPAINGRLSNFAGDAALAALISTTTSTTCLFLYVLVIRPELPALAVLRSGPWWMWTGGLIGAAYVAISLNVAQRLGVTTLAAVVLVGQLVAALFADHYGLFGLSEQPISLTRVIGVLLLIAGVALIRFF